MKAKNSVLLPVLLVFFALLLLCVSAGAALLYFYNAAQPGEVPMPTATLGDTVLTPEQTEWYAPVLGGLLQKPFSQQTSAAAQPLVFEQAHIPVQFFAQGLETTFAVTSPSGQPCVLQTQPDGTLALEATESGLYQYELIFTRPRAGEQPYGTLRRAGSFTVVLPPEVLFSSVEIAQGGVETVLVRNVPEGVQPQAETALGYVRTVRHGTAWTAYVGAAYNTLPGQYDVTVTCGELVSTQAVTVKQGVFTRQDMTIDTSVADSTVNSEDANKQWRDAIFPLYETGDDTLYWQGTFTPPLQKTVLNTEYGLFRYTNGSATAVRHGGVDMDGETGDPVFAPAAGRVVLARFLTLTGNTVVIEHGAGLKTYYFHMDKLHCAEGQTVAQAQQIGEVGTTGYSTGAHLHFEAKIGRNSIDPMALFDGTSGIYFAG